MRGRRSSRIGGQASNFHDGASEALAPTGGQSGGGRLDEDDHPPASDLPAARNGPRLLYCPTWGKKCMHGPIDQVMLYRLTLPEGLYSTIGIREATHPGGEGAPLNKNNPNGTPLPTAK